MNKLFAYLLGAGYGAGLMYFMDPIQGKQRRLQIRDQAVRIRNDADDLIEAGVMDMQNRARGMFVETTKRFSKDTSDDWVLAERARSRLGYLTSYPRGVVVSAKDGNIILTGDVVHDDVDRLINGLGAVRGIHKVENRLKVHDTLDTIPGYQSQMEKTRLGRTTDQWSPSIRLLAGIGSLYLLLRGRRGGLPGPFYSMGGFALGLRTITNMNFRRMMGKTEDQGAINVVKSIHIQAPVEEVYDLWANFPNFSRFMTHVKSIHEMGGGRSHWVVDGPAGVPVEFDTQIMEQIPNELIAWETLPDSTIRHAGQVRFHETRGNGTQVNVRMTYTPPAGIVGHVVAAFFGKDPKSEMDDDLIRLKSILETGKTRADGVTIFHEEVSRKSTQY